MPDDERVKQAVRLVLLLLPPANRRRLHLLLRFLSKVKANTELQLADSPDALQTLVSFYFCLFVCFGVVVVFFFFLMHEKMISRK